MLNWYLTGGGVSSACTNSTKGWLCIAVPKVSTHIKKFITNDYIQNYDSIRSKLQRILFNYPFYVVVSIIEHLLLGQDQVYY